MKIPKPNLTRLQNTGLKKPYRSMLAVIALVVLAVFVAGLGMLRTKRSQNVGNSICSQAIIQEARNYMHTSKRDQLKPVVDKIRALENFEKDINCLYISFTYQLNSFEPEQARTTLQKLEQLYDKQAIDPLLLLTDNIDNMRQRLAAEEHRKAETEQNGRALTGVR